jgi:hypothetical protein
VGWRSTHAQPQRDLFDGLDIGLGVQGLAELKRRRQRLLVLLQAKLSPLLVFIDSFTHLGLAEQLQRL